MNLMERLLRPLDPARTWSPRARHWYVLTIPVSFPLHMMYCIMIVVLGLILGCALWIAAWCVEVWMGKTIDELNFERRVKARGKS